MKGLAFIVALAIIAVVLSISYISGTSAAPQIPNGKGCDLNGVNECVFGSLCPGLEGKIDGLGETTNPGVFEKKLQNTLEWMNAKAAQCGYMANKCGTSLSNLYGTGDPEDLCDVIVPECLANDQCPQGEACVNSMCQPLCVPSTEVCDGIDNDCDALIDENIALSCYTGPQGTLGVGLCSAGTQSCTSGSFGSCVNQVLPSPESCNGLDDDCDGAVDDSLGSTTCGTGQCKVTVLNCLNGVAQSCTPGTPGTEVCDNFDNDCDGAVDENIVNSCYTGPSGTNGIGVCSAGTQSCTSGSFGSCVNQVLPSPESCNGLDDDCDGAVDENTNTNTDPNNCGGCGVVCSSNNIAALACTSGTCTGSCNSGFLDCNANKLADGCEINILNSFSNCGGCGITCLSGQSCVNGVCQ